MAEADILLQNIEMGMGGASSAAVYAPRVKHVLRQDKNSICDSGKGIYQIMKASVDIETWNHLVGFLHTTSQGSVSKFENYRIVVDGVNQQIRLPRKEFNIRDYDNRIITICPIEHGRHIMGYRFLTERCYLENTRQSYQTSLTKLILDFTQGTLEGDISDRFYKQSVWNKIKTVIAKGIASIGTGWVLLFAVVSIIKVATLKTAAITAGGLKLGALITATFASGAFWPITGICSLLFLLWVLSDR